MNDKTNPIVVEMIEELTIDKKRKDSDEIR